MIAYGIGMFSIINNLKHEIPDVPQPWYADNARSLGKLAILATYFDSLTRQGLGRAYYHEPSKSVLIVRPDNFETGKSFEEHHRFKFCKYVCYLGGYISDNKSKHDWLRGVH